MKPIRLLIISLLLSINCVSQTAGIVRYSGYWPKAGIVQGYGTLLFNDSYASVTADSSYVINHNEMRIVDSTTYDGENRKEYIHISKSIPHTGVYTVNDPFHLFYDFEEGFMYQVIDRTTSMAFESIPDTLFLLKEQLARTNWQISDEQKQIGRFMCHKATGRVKGRDYIVWFTLEIPVGLGPWKLNGLPGLILEATDSKNEVRFLATYIEIGETLPKVKPIPDAYKIDIQQYIGLIDTHMNNILKKSADETKRIQSKQPKGFNYNYSISFKMKGLELDHN